MANIEQIKGADNGNPPDKLSEAYPKINRSLTNMNNQVINHEGRLGTAEAAVSNHGSRIAEAETKLVNQDNRITTIVAHNGDGTKDTELIDARGNKPILSARLDATDAQLADIASDASFYGADPGKGDNTASLQSALNKGGTVNVTKPGDYYTRTLYIGSDTSLCLGQGVRLILIGGTSDYLIVNKGEVAEPKYRDKNISINGGEYNYNGENNPITGAYSAGLFPGHGIFLNKVDGVKVTNIAKAGRAVKYAFLLVDVTNVVIDNVNFDNESDGFHFQAPIKNIRISNITGYTGDNCLGFTTGDYSTFVVSENGDGENILIENLFLGSVDKPVNGPIRFVGAGKSDLGFYDNIEIKNIVVYMTTLNPVVEFMGADQAVANDYLKSTRIKNVQISNVKCLSATTSRDLISAAARVDNMTVSDMEVTATLQNKILTAIGTVGNLYLRNIKFEGGGTTRDYAQPFFYFGTEWSQYTVKNLTFDNCRFEIASGTDFVFIKSVNNSIQQLNICNSLIKFDSNKGYMLDFDGSNKSTLNPVNISNSTMTGIKNRIKNNCHLSINNCHVDAAGFKIADLAGVGILRLLVASSNFSFSVDGLTGAAKLSYNGTSAVCSHPLNQLTPQNGDVFNVIYGAYAGIYRLGGSSTFYQLSQTAITV
ncbi:hypothetical protein H70357_10680 [Paenibacillus sp. FSL H7-0357]|uniref:hypothetical protein n=1 Tax=Paenibacillus sp. FSL H7-0357 TaxID=1536774 RepID=UPI0004F821B5|nr:hypothetical protein [Paenibacillus sp. FSL H7-0357]AIQ17073.1 hypothetical protein H70357_10680 [Paenibacillus sp. FSL H7-0357]